MKKVTYLMTAVLTLFSAVAVAGLIIDFPVEVVVNGDGTVNVRGNMATARFSDNDIEYIGCITRVTDLGGGNVSEFGLCQAGDSAAVEVSGFTLNPALIQTIKSIADYSFLLFNINDVGECIRVGVSTNSFYIPDVE